MFFYIRPETLSRGERFKPKKDTDLKKLLLLTLFSGIIGVWFAEAQTYTVSGYVKDAKSGEDLIGATILVKGTDRGAATNAYGFYSITLPQGEYELIFSYLGYLQTTSGIVCDKDLMINIGLESESRQLEEVVISKEKAALRERLRTTQMSLENISMREAKLIPALLGEVDIVKTLQLKPGVQPGNEGSAGFNVRGGNADQNLVVLDEATVYNASHLFGFFSIFNSDAVKGADLYKGDFPAKYGGRLSSVLDVKLKDGNKKRFSGAGGLGVIASRLTLEGPIVKDKASYIVSGRRTYFDIITRQINRANEGKEDYNPIPDYYFYDLNAKVNYELGPKDRLFLSGYFGRDKFGFNDENFDFDFDWGNTTTTLRWNHIFNNKLFVNTSLIFSDYKYSIRNRFDVFSFRLSSGIQDYDSKVDFDYIPNDKHTIRFGGRYTFHKFKVGRFKAGTDDGTISFSSGQDFIGTDLGMYVSEDYEPNDRWKFNAGIRLSGFQNGSSFYFGPEPRFSVRYRVNDQISLKAGYARMYQYIHLVSNSGVSLPTDVWYPSNAVVRPQISDQIAAGISMLLFDDKYLITNELYYKPMRQQIDFRDGAQLFANPDLNQEFVFGRGVAYGNELCIEKREGKLTGWLGYTLAWTKRKFAEINNGNYFPANSDIRHNLTLVAMYEVSRRISLSLSFVFNTGRPVTLPIGRFLFQDQPGVDPVVVPIYGDRNSFRMASYHRLDLGFVWKFFPRWGESDLTIGIYNAYDRRNPYFIYFDEVPAKLNEPVPDLRARQVSLFPILPAITYNFKF